jgi:hypothetical protein
MQLPPGSIPTTHRIAPLFRARFLGSRLTHRMPSRQDADREHRLRRCLRFNADVKWCGAIGRSSRILGTSDDLHILGAVHQTLWVGASNPCTAKNNSQSPRDKHEVGRER